MALIIKIAEIEMYWAINPDMAIPNPIPISSAGKAWSWLHPYG
jgi:hypothetical protein